MCLALLVDREEGEGVSSSSYPSFIFFSGPHCRRLIFPASHLSTFSPTRRHLSLSLSLSLWLTERWEVFAGCCRSYSPLPDLGALIYQIWILLCHWRLHRLRWSGWARRTRSRFRWVCSASSKLKQLTYTMFMFLLVSAAVLTAWFHLTVHVWSPTAVNIFQTFQ